jgi:dienelactone hydrolase
MRLTRQPGLGIGLTSDVRIPLPNLALDGDLFLPADPAGLVIFAHGAGSSRHSARTRYVAEHLHGSRFATLLVDLLVPDEHAIDAQTEHLQFDVALLADRLVGVVDWAAAEPRLRALPIGCTASNTAGAAAVLAAVQRSSAVRAIVSRGGRLHLAGKAMAQLRVPTLLIVGGADLKAVRANVEAMGRVPGVVQLDVLPGETHAFDGPGALEEIARLSADWFGEHLTSRLGAA